MKNILEEIETVKETVHNDKPKTTPPTQEQLKEFNKVWEDIDEVSAYIESQK